MNRNRLLSVRVVTFVVALFVSGGTWADTETVGGYTWTYRINDGTAEVYNDGSVAAISPKPTGTVTIPSVLGGKPVTSIGDSAFRNCGSLTSVTIPNSVTSIEDDAFWACSGLTSVTIPNSVTSIGPYAFFGTPFYEHQPNGLVVFGKVAYKMKGTCLAMVVIPDGVTSIGSQAFSGCSDLKNVTIPNSVTSIGSQAFSGCSGLTSVTIPNSVTSIGDCAFSGCTNLTSVTIPDGVMSIGGSAFSYCSGLTSVTIPDNLTSIRAYTFYGCSGLTSVTIPDSVTSVGNYAYSGCSGLTSMKLPRSIRDIGESVFANCRGLTNATISSAVESIGHGVFAGCASLQKLTLPFVGAMREWGEYVAQSDSYVHRDGVVYTIQYPSGGNLGHLFSWDAFDGGLQISQKASGLYHHIIPVAGGVGGSDAGDYLDQKDVNVYLPTSLTEIVVTDAKGLGYGAFSGCSMLKSVTLSEGMTTIESHAFNGCTGLTQLTIPDDVTTLGDSVFSGCSRLTKLTLPDCLATVGNYAFSGCSGLSNMELPDGVWAIGDGAFNGCGGLTELTLPVSVQYVGTSAFSGCGGLKWVTVPQCVCASSISSVFPDAYKKIEKIVLGAGTTSIASSMFRECVGLRSVIVPNTVTSIGQDAFYNCSSLEAVYYRGNAPDASSIYWGTPRTLVSYVPVGSVGWMGDVASTDLPEMWNSRAIAWETMPEMTSEEALNVSALRFEMSGDASWHPDATESHDGVASMRSGAIGDGGETRMQTTVRGAGRLSFWWKVSSESFKGFRIDHVSFEIDGEERAWMGGEEGWTNMAFEVAGEGEHTFSWTYRKDADGGTEGADCAWVDEVRWVGNVSSPDEALDAVGMSFATGGDAAWRLDYDAGCVDAVSMRSGPIGDGQVSWIETTVVGPGTAAFSWKTSSETYKSYQVDYLSFEVDGEEKEWVGGETDWRRVSVAVTGSGKHTLRWTYRKDPTDFAGYDCGWLDAVSWTPSGAAAGLESWLAGRGLTANARAANGRTAAECYALGLDPAEATNDFRIVSIELVDGKPKVEWTPKTNRWTGKALDATLKGAATLDGEWKVVEGATAAEKAAMRFFKVVVVP